MHRGWVETSRDQRRSQHDHQKDIAGRNGHAHAENEAGDSSHDQQDQGRIASQIHRSLASVPARPVSEKAPTIKPTPARRPANSAKAAVMPCNMRSKPAQFKRCLAENWLISSSTTVA